MKKLYFLFAFDGYYPAGGMYDLHGTFESVESAVAAFNADSRDYYQIATIGDNGKLEVVAANCEIDKSW